MNRDEAFARLRTNEALEEEVDELRVMLCMSYCDHPYTDDGELQSGDFPVIDFKRDTIQEIKKKMSDRLTIEILQNNPWKDIL